MLSIEEYVAAFIVVFFGLILPVHLYLYNQRRRAITQRHMRQRQLMMALLAAFRKE